MDLVAVLIDPAREPSHIGYIERLHTEAGDAYFPKLQTGKYHQSLHLGYTCSPEDAERVACYWYRRLILNRE